MKRFVTKFILSVIFSIIACLLMNIGNLLAWSSPPPADDCPFHKAHLIYSRPR